MAFAVGDLVVAKESFYKIIFKVIGLHEDRLWVIAHESPTRGQVPTDPAPSTVYAHLYEPYQPFFEKGRVYNHKGDDRISVLVYMIRVDSDNTKVAFGKLMTEDEDGNVSFIWETFRQADFQYFEASPRKDEATD